MDRSLETRVPQPLQAHRTLTALDGLFPPIPSHSAWVTNGPSARGGGPGYTKARFFFDLVVRGTTALADAPAVTFRPYVRSGGSSGRVGIASSATSFTRPRLLDAPTIKAQVTTDNGSNYTDASANVIDNSTGTGLTLNSLNTVAMGDWFVIGGPSPFCGAAIDVQNTNSNDVALAVHYWNGTAWTAVSNLTDGTYSSGTLAADGQVTWDGGTGAPLPADWAASTINSISAYWTRWSVDGAVDSSVLVAEIDLLFPIKGHLDIQCDGDDVMLLMEQQTASVTGTVAYNGLSYVSWR